MPRTPNIYFKGATIRYTAAFTVNDIPTDPTAILLKVKEPDGTISTYTYGIDPEVFKDSMGNYHGDVQVLSGGGILTYRFEGTGAAAAVNEKTATILNGAF